ncbi:MAG: SGNH/GDSL hydrolase family protein [Akkermansiaceae bacterium]
MLAKILAFLGLSGCVLPEVKGERKALNRRAQSDEFAVLFIGNSYSFGVPSEFRKIAESKGKKVRVGHSTYGGWSLAKHSEHGPTLKKLDTGNWDVVVLQDYSLNPAKPELERRKAMDPAVQLFASKTREQGAIPVLYQTWGRRDGDPEKSDDDFFQMNLRVRSGYHAASERGGGIVIAPVGDVWETKLEEGRGESLFVEDGSHPSDFGNEVSANVIYNTIFGG